MLNGIDPIIIFQFKKALPSVSEQLAKIPLVASYTNFIESPPIPIYLSETLTGLFIDSESKSIDSETNTETKTDGSAPDINQKGINSVVKIEIVANKNSLGLTLLTALSDLLYEKLTSKEYAVSYLNGAVTIFNGLIHSFSIQQSANNELYNISIEISRGPYKSPTKVELVPSVIPTTGALPL
jgi:hypothetical protein